MKEPILLVMAAGMGSRYGGLKQIDPVGPAGEVILDYSIYDARKAGFKRVIFLIKHEIEEEFKEKVGRHIEKFMEVQYAFQDVSMIPAGFTVPEGRKKPWGTAHAVLCCKDCIDAPFAAINADDYYGTESFRMAYDFLTKVQTRENQGKAHFMMVGYMLCNTLTENGFVSRGVCSVDENGLLSEVCERTHIISTCDGPMFTLDGNTYTILPKNTVVSMNMWGFTPDILENLERDFTDFQIEQVPKNPLKAEHYLPSTVSRMVNDGSADVKVYPCEDKWYGVTYHEDRAVVMEAFRKMTDSGIYPAKLWD